MPNYTWKNKETGEEFTNSMTMAEHDEYTKNNPHLEQVLRNFTFVDPVSIGVTKPPDRKSTRLNSSHSQQSRMPSSA